MKTANEHQYQNRIRVYFSNRLPRVLTASFEKLEESQQFFLIREISELTDRLHVVYLPGSDKHVALTHKEDAEYLASLIGNTSHETRIVPPALEAGFLLRWATTPICDQGDTLYGDIDLDSECGGYSLTIGREQETIGGDMIIKITLYENDIVNSDYYESDKDAVLHLFGERFSRPDSSLTTRWLWDYETWLQWLKRFREDLSEEVGAELDGRFVAFHAVRMWAPFQTDIEGIWLDREPDATVDFDREQLARMCGV